MKKFSEVLEEYLDWRGGEQAAIDDSPGYTPKGYYRRGAELCAELDSYVIEKRELSAAPAFGSLDELI